MTQGQRQNFNWRPNDYSSTTRLRYDMEVGHWMESIKGFGSKTTSSLSDTIGTIGLLLGLTVNLLLIIVLIFLQLSKWILNLMYNDTVVVEEKLRDVPLTSSELQERLDNNELPIVDIYED